MEKPRAKLPYDLDSFRREGGRLLSAVRTAGDLESARSRLVSTITRIYASVAGRSMKTPPIERVRSRDCFHALMSMLNSRSDEVGGFSLAQALWDLAAGRARDDLGEGFFAEMVHLVRGLEGHAKMRFPWEEKKPDPALTGRAASIARSRELDRLWKRLETQMSRFADGLGDDSRRRRAKRRADILAALGASESQWNDWRWQVRNLATSADGLARLAPLCEEERRNIAAARRGKLPFAVTPYYASLMDAVGGERDRAVRAQVIPPAGYVRAMRSHRDDWKQYCDFMLESDTSPVDLVTRRYPGIVILKPYNTCPQICVYCQRNWEIKQAMDPAAMASRGKIAAAIDWIRKHPAVREVLLTGGDPMVMSDGRLREILERLAEISHVDLVRIGTRTPVTLPMRITPELAEMLGSFRQPGRREIAVVTHVEHPYEITPELAGAIDRLRRNGIAVYNQQVYTFFVSRRFETARLRLLLRRVGVDPYYTFAPKGKEETADYRVPIARILQERKEEARLLPGLRRTDEPVFNVPGLGKNHLRAIQHRDLLTIRPDGARVYEFHPWEKNVANRDTYVTADVPIWDYLRRLEAIGERADDYRSIWYYY